MKIKSGFILKRGVNRNIIAPTGERALVSKQAYEVNDAGAYIFSLLLKQDLTTERIADALVREYGIDASTAARDSELFVEAIRSIGALEE